MDWLITGRITGAFGLEGAVKVISSSGEYEHLLQLESITVGSSDTQKRGNEQHTRYEVEWCELRFSDALLKLRDIDSPEAAKKLRGSSILVPRDMACPLNEGEFYITDLCKCVLIYEETTIGTITDVVEGGDGFLLEISEAATRKQKYIPFNAQFIGTVDIESKRVELMHRWILE